MTQSFPAKDPRETVVLTFNATPELDTGETLTAITRTDVGTSYGTDASAASVISGGQITEESITIGTTTIAAGNAVQAIASSGLNDCGYLIAITCATTNPNKILTLKGVLPVSST